MYAIPSQIAWFNMYQIVLPLNRDSSAFRNGTRPQPGSSNPNHVAMTKQGSSDPDEEVQGGLGPVPP